MRDVLQVLQVETTGWRSFLQIQASLARKDYRLMEREARFIFENYEEAQIWRLIFKIIPKNPKVVKTIFRFICLIPLWRFPKLMLHKQKEKFFYRQFVLCETSPIICIYSPKSNQRNQNSIIHTHTHFSKHPRSGWGFLI